MTDNGETSRTVFQVEVARCLRRPQPHGVDNIVPVAGDGGVVGQSQHHLSGEPHRDTDWYVHFKSVCF